MVLVVNEDASCKSCGIWTERKAKKWRACGEGWICSHAGEFSTTLQCINTLLGAKAKRYLKSRLWRAYLNCWGVRKPCGLDLYLDPVSLSHETSLIFLNPSWLYSETYCLSCGEASYCNSVNRMCTILKTCRRCWKSPKRGQISKKD